MSSLEEDDSIETDYPSTATSSNATLLYSFKFNSSDYKLNLTNETLLDGDGGLSLGVQVRD